jgi:hypothetical protein
LGQRLRIGALFARVRLVVTIIVVIVVLLCFVPAILVALALYFVLAGVVRTAQGLSTRWGFS